MKKTFLLFFILASFLLLSCTADNETLENLYENKEYETLIKEAQKACQKGIDEENLYYLMMGYYELKEYSEATELAYLYKTLYPEPNNNNKVALTILMYNDRTIESYNAAVTLINNYNNLTITDYRLYFTLATIYAPDKAIELYNAISPRLSNKDKLTLLSTGFAPIIYVLSALDAYYEETGGNEDYQLMLTKVLEKYSKLDITEDINILLSFAVDTIQNNTKGHIYIGDLYYKLGYKTAASKHWNAALASYPAEVKSRLFKYQ